MKITTDNRGNVIIDIAEPEKLTINSYGDVILGKMGDVIDAYGEEAKYELLKGYGNGNGVFDDIVAYDQTLKHTDNQDDDLLTQLDKRINDCRHYLMGVLPENLTVEDALEALGFQRNGLSS